MSAINNKLSGSLLIYIGGLMVRNEIDLTTAVRETLNSTKIHESRLVSHLLSNGFDGEAVMPDVATSLSSLGLTGPDAVNTFAEMLASLEMHRDGMITTPELILALQCSRIQVSNLIRHSSLPPNVFRKISITDWDPE